MNFDVAVKQVEDVRHCRFSLFLVSKRKVDFGEVDVDDVLIVEVVEHFFDVEI